jgi:predicted HicB family RNase H-like nuclease
VKRYKGYDAGSLVFDEDGRVLFGVVTGLRDVVTFEVRKLADLPQAFHDSVDDYLAMCAARGEQPKRPTVPVQQHAILTPNAGSFVVSIYTDVPSTTASAPPKAEP